KRLRAFCPAGPGPHPNQRRYRSWIGDQPRSGERNGGRPHPRERSRRRLDVHADSSIVDRSFGGRRAAPAAAAASHAAQQSSGLILAFFPLDQRWRGGLYGGRSSSSKTKQGRSQVPSKIPPL